MVLPSSAWTFGVVGSLLGDSLVKLAGAFEQLDPQGVHGRNEQELVLAHLGVEAFHGIEGEPEVGLGPLLRFLGSVPFGARDRALASEPRVVSEAQGEESHGRDDTETDQHGNSRSAPRPLRDPLPGGSGTGQDRPPGQEAPQVVEPGRRRPA